MTVTIHQRAIPREDHRQTMLKGLHDQIVGLLMLIVALVLCMVPMVQQDGAKDAQVNEAIIGTVVLFAAASRLYRGSGMRSDLVVGIAGAWLVASPFLLDVQKTSIYASNRVLDIVLGSALVLLAAIGLLLMWAGRRQATDKEA
ncbi:hypothetical protein AB0953_25300 [Streptomyces sp. NPDC046866]|uniref:SPW repeat domain-containing protein n=1 Tax=Streptomyces sp. NPDC046866 TaxID=3154921 RepID=UPI003456FB80